jgi:Putative zinc-finger
MIDDLFHPEVLLDRERRGELTPDERAQLHHHLRECDACRLERAMRESVELPLTLDDDLLLARATRQAEARFLQSPAHRFAGAQVRWSAVAAGLLVVGVGFAAGAAAWPGLVKRFGRSNSPPPSAVATSSPGHAIFEPSPTPPPVAAEAPTEGLAFPVAPGEAPAPATRGRQADGPDEVFARANQARRRGEAESAARLYRDLQTQFPRSREAVVSGVTLGRLMLDRLDQPARALAQFDRYLTVVRQGGLREEALIGRALALAQLGRGVEEQSAWGQLLKEFPDSIYSERARARLEGRSR